MLSRRGVGCCRFTLLPSILTPASRLRNGLVKCHWNAWPVHSGKVRETRGLVRSSPQTRTNPYLSVWLLKLLLSFVLQYGGYIATFINQISNECASNFVTYTSSDFQKLNVRIKYVHQFNIYIYIYIYILHVFTMDVVTHSSPPLTMLRNAMAFIIIIMNANVCEKYN